MSLALVPGLLLSSSLLLALGVALPIMEVQPHLGPYHEYLAYFIAELGERQSFSILSAVLHLFADRVYVLGVIVLLFSVLFPLWKISVLWLGFLELAQGRLPGTLFYVAERLGKYSMVDVFVIALIIVALKGLPGGSQVVLQPGLYCFIGSGLILMTASWLIEVLLLKH